MTANAFPFFNTQFRDDTTDAVAAFYLLYTYISTTTTPKTTYSDAAGSITNANPVVLDAMGRCSIFGALDAAYTFVLKNPSGTTIKTWDGISATPNAAGTGFLPLSGGELTGLITLSGDATASLNPVSKQQLDAAIAASSASVTALVATATAAAAAATAAVAAFAPFSFSLAVGTGSAATRTVTLAAGTYQVVLDTRASYAPGSEANHDFTVTQAATVGSTTVNTSLHFFRSGGGGFGRITHATNLAVGTLTVAATGPFTMSIAAASLGSAASDGSRMTLEKTA